MPEQDIDVKTEADSSPAQPDVKPDSASSPATPSATDVKPTSLLDVAKKAFDESVARNEPESSTAPKEEEEESVSESNTDEEPPAQEEKTEDATEEESEAAQPESEHEEAVPYKRFNEVNSKLKATEVERDGLKAKAEIYDGWTSTLTKHNVAEEDFKAAVDVLCLANTDPEKALAAIDSVRAKLLELTGNEFTAEEKTSLQEIEAEVEDGTLSRARADQMKKLISDSAKLRGNTKLNEVRQRSTQEQAQKAQLKAYWNDVGTTVKSWTDSTQKTIPEMAPGGKLRGTFDKFYETNLSREMAKAGQYLTPSQYVEVATATLKEVRALFSSTAPKVRAGLSSTKTSSTQPKPGTRTALQVAAEVAAKHGIKMPTS